MLRFHPRIAPVKAAVFPLLANRPELIARAREIYSSLRREYSVAWDDIGNIGKRYRRQDEIGTPFTVTVDFETLENGSVTVRDRDTMKQERLGEKEIKAFLKERIA